MRFVGSTELPCWFIASPKTWCLHLKVLHLRKVWDPLKVNDRCGLPTTKTLQNGKGMRKLGRLRSLTFDSVSKFHYLFWPLRLLQLVWSISKKCCKCAQGLGKMEMMPGTARYCASAGNLINHKFATASRILAVGPVGREVIWGDFSTFLLRKFVFFGLLAGKNAMSSHQNGDWCDVYAVNIDFERHSANMAGLHAWHHVVKAGKTLQHARFHKAIVNKELLSEENHVDT